MNNGYIKYTDSVSTFMVGASLFVSSVSVIVCSCSLFNPVNPNCKDLADEQNCDNYSWMKMTAISLACLPLMAWLLMGPSVRETCFHLFIDIMPICDVITIPLTFVLQSGARMIINIVHTALYSLFTPLLFAGHQYNATPLHVASRLQDLTWRGNKVMQSEHTVNSAWVKYCAWIIIFIETMVVLLSNASPIAATRVYHVNIEVFTLFILASQFAGIAVGFWLCFENGVRAFCRFVTKDRSLPRLEEDAR